ncbi:PQQ-dependent sugar dehydrogenase [Paenibacillus sp. HB172176]|uniref:PQQ-dependent sugar dehydrogenase n=1 Tax=Paenibacillus sp. HB172176 TaxID=2493690 RepID=UPI001F0E1EF5|nr:PQQ-dependent sugar dehydrogenase [Paenibacillus sp. HB172176]
MLRKLGLIAIAAMVAIIVAGCRGESNNASNHSGNTAGGNANEMNEAQTTGNEQPEGQPDPTASMSSNNDGQGDAAESDQDSEPEPEQEPYQVIAEGLKIPWSIAFAGDTIYLSEREGDIVELKDEKLERQKVNLSKAVHHEGEGGFLGLLLAQDFNESGLAYAYHTYAENGATKNRVVLLKQSGSAWEEQRALLEDIPGDLYHNGGRLAFGPDDMLYVTTGDATEGGHAQDKDSLGGKILRMTPDGDIPPDNPFENSYVYSYGHRNPQGLAWTADGVMYSTEHGPSGNVGGHDEINRIEPGGNYGWPDVIGDQKLKGTIAPLYHTGDEAIAPSGTIIDEEGRLIIAALKGEAIYRYTPSTGEMEKLHDGEGRIRDVKLKEGLLYFITNNRDGRGQPGETDDRLVAIKL